MSASGEAAAFGGSGSYVHLWAGSATPRIVAHTRPHAELTHPELPEAKVCAVLEQQ